MSDEKDKDTIQIPQESVGVRSRSPVRRANQSVYGLGAPTSASTLAMPPLPLSAISTTEAEWSGEYDNGGGRQTKASVWRQHQRHFIGEFIGTYVLVAGCLANGSTAVLAGFLQGGWQAGILDGVSVAAAIYTTASISGAHLNPAVSLAMAVFGKHTGFKWSSLPIYIIAQILGGILAAATNLAIWHPFITRFEQMHDISSRTIEPGCSRTAMLFGEFFPNPDVFATGIQPTVTPLHALMAEAYATFFLML
eukprot:jgi/Hompol1/842/HPOL_005440-RA